MSLAEPTVDSNAQPGVVTVASPDGTSADRRSLAGLRGADSRSAAGDSPGRPFRAVVRVAVRWAGRGVRAVAGPALLAAVWEVAPRTGLADPVFLPPLHAVLTRWWQLADAGDIWAHSQASLVRAGTGLLIALSVALPLGLVIGWVRPIAELLNPVLNVFWNTAVLALLPVFVLFFGIGEESKIAIVAYACLWPILLNTINGVRTVDPLLVRAARSLGLGPVRLFQKVILPGAVPTVFTGIRMSAAASLLVLVAAEMVGAREGLGFLIINSQANFSIPDMYAAIITVSGIGLAVNQVLLAIEWRLSRWRST
ncbi:MAG TPA: ABC transporter permease [Kineosporiaceae bacterium]|nr:ABC transporter permease [Kineosporiaceae bacterium]